MLAATKRELREHFTRELADLQMVSETVKHHIVERALTAFGALPDGKRYEYDKVGGKRDCAMKLAWSFIENGEFPQEPPNGLNNEIRFQKDQLESLLQLKMRLFSEFEAIDEGRDISVNRPMISTLWQDKTYKRYEQMRETTRRDIAAVINILNTIGFNLSVMERVRDGKVKNVISAISVLVAVGFGYKRNEIMQIDRVIATAKSLTDEDAFSIRLSALRTGQLNFLGVPPNKE